VPGTAPGIHADCHWGNWRACGRSVTALLDFEWARFGEPADDWFFLARFSGPHMETVLDVIARATATSPETLRAQCEAREAAYLASDSAPRWNTGHAACSGKGRRAPRRGEGTLAGHPASARRFAPAGSACAGTHDAGTGPPPRGMTGRVRFRWCAVNASGESRQRFAAVGTVLSTALGAVCAGGVEHYANEPCLPIVW
jgi:hypothetical protein